jgi:hypothetical protein
VGFEVDKVALGQDFLKVLQFSPVNIIPPYITWGMNKSPAGGRSSETLSHPINIKNIDSGIVSVCRHSEGRLLIVIVVLITIT